MKLAVCWKFGVENFQTDTDNECALIEINKNDK